MQVDWFTTGAQIVNFLILVIVLKYLLYDRIVRAMTRRQEELEAERARVDEAETEAQDRREEYDRLRRELEEQRDALLEKARSHAAEKRDELMAGAREAVDEQRRTWAKGLEREQDDLVTELSRTAGEGAFRLSEVLLQRLASEELDTAVVERFLDELQELPASERRRLLEHDARAPVATVRSASEISPGRRAHVTRVIHEVFNEDLEVHFEVEADLICGVTLEVGYHAIGWNARDALDDLREQLRSVLEETARLVHHHQAEEGRGAEAQTA